MVERVLKAGSRAGRWGELGVAGPAAGAVAAHGGSCQAGQRPHTSGPHAACEPGRPPHRPPLPAGSRAGGKRQLAGWSEASRPPRTPGLGTFLRTGRAALALGGGGARQEGLRGSGLHPLPGSMPRVPRPAAVGGKQPDLGTPLPGPEALGGREAHPHLAAAASSLGGLVLKGRACEGHVVRPGWAGGGWALAGRGRAQTQREGQGRAGGWGARSG